MVTSFVYVHGSKLGLNKGYLGETLVGISGGGKYLSVREQEDGMCNGKEPVEVRGGGDGVATATAFWTMEGYTVGF